MPQQESPIHDLAQLLRQLNPILHPGTYLFCCLENDAEKYWQDAVFAFREAEGTTLVLRKEFAEEHQLEGTFPSAWISLEVNSALDAVGLTAAVSKALAQAGISCNSVAAFHHDHLFVPQEKGSAAMQVLKKLSRTGLRE